MQTFNKWMGIGRLSRDPEVKTFGNGGKMCNVGFCVNERKKNPQTGQWEDSPIWIDLKVFDRGEGHMGSNFGDWFQKGDPVFIEGKLAMDEWQDKTTGQKRQKLYIVVDRFISLKPPDPNQQQGGQQGGQQRQPQQQAPRQQGNQTPRQQRRQNGSQAQYNNNYGNQSDGGYDGGGGDDPIPF